MFHTLIFSWVIRNYLHFLASQLRRPANLLDVWLIIVDSLINKAIPKNPKSALLTLLSVEVQNDSNTIEEIIQQRRSFPIVKYRIVVLILQ